MKARAALLAALLACAAVLGGCGKQAAPKVDKVDAATEREAATQRAREGPFGTQMKALDTAKALGAQVNQKAEDEMKQVDGGK